jgi:pantoate--beta-alanine ligase|tara:strand:+ start:1277 stop:2113 length:837 start_codon:yes stop_codon:yes gene_type:complete
MKIFKTKESLSAYLNLLDKKISIGFVPTMGAIHNGHLKLIETSKKQCRQTICSIFINPTQFNNKEDYKSYPKKLDEDYIKLQQAKCDLIYAPEVSDLYKKNETAKKFNFKTLDLLMEGKFRENHFNGVATVIEKLFQIIKPTKAYFGEKDIQQLQIVKSLVNQINSKTIIIGVPTVREKNGLAMSSRNKLLSFEEKEKASIIYNCLNYCRNNKNQSISKLKKHIIEQFNKAQDIHLEYAEFVSLNNMQSINKWEKEKNNAICIAAYINKVRLIDNIIL